MPRRQERVISKRTVDALSVEGLNAVFWDRDLPGFGIRVYPSGLKTYVVQSRGPGGSRRATLGRHGEISAEQGRRRAAEAIDRIKQGEAPLPPASEPEATMAVIADRYMRDYVATRCKASSAEVYRRALDNHILPAPREMPVGAVGREHVSKLHYAMRGEPHAANAALKIVGKMLSLAVEWGLRETGPTPSNCSEKQHRHAVRIAAHLRFAASMRPYVRWPPLRKSASSPAPGSMVPAYYRDILQQRPGTRDSGTQSAHPSAQPRVGSVDQRGRPIRKRAHHLHNAVVRAIPAAMPCMNDSKAFLRRVCAARPGSIEHDRPYTAAAAGQRGDFGHESPRGPGAVAPPAIGTRAHYVVAIHKHPDLLGAFLIWQDRITKGQVVMQRDSARDGQLATKPGESSGFCQETPNMLELRGLPTTSWGILELNKIASKMEHSHVDFTVSLRRVHSGSRAHCFDDFTVPGIGEDCQGLHRLHRRPARLRACGDGFRAL